MFVLEINFHDGISQPEMLLVRRHRAVIGSGEFAHVVIEGAASSFYELRVSRGIGREFRCQPISRKEGTEAVPSFLDGVYSGEADFDLGGVTTHITAVDLDLQYQSGESPDRAGLRVLRRALTAVSPKFPAIALLGPEPLSVSFPVDQPLLVGRSRKCGFRLDSPEISNEHARIGYNDGNFWVEDVGSSNGTFVGRERVSGRRVLREDETIVLGSDYILAGLRNPQDLRILQEKPASHEPYRSVSRERFPCIRSLSDSVRPSRFVLTPGARVTIGRDPANDIWIGAPHISRSHAELTFQHAGSVMATDLSSNGVWYQGERLARGNGTPLAGELAVLDFGAGISVGLCFSEGGEKQFVEMSSGAVKVKNEGQGLRQLFDEQGKPVYDTSSLRVNEERKDLEKEVEAFGSFQRFVERARDLSRAEGETVRGEPLALSELAQRAEGERGGIAQRGMRLLGRGRFMLFGVSIFGLGGIIAWFTFIGISSLIER